MIACNGCNRALTWTDTKPRCNDCRKLDKVVKDAKPRELTPDEKDLVGYREGLDEDELPEFIVWKDDIPGYGNTEQETIDSLRHNLQWHEDSLFLDNSSSPAPAAEPKPIPKQQKLLF